MNNLDVIQSLRSTEAGRFIIFIDPQNLDNNYTLDMPSPRIPQYCVIGPYHICYCNTYAEALDYIAESVTAFRSALTVEPLRSKPVFVIV